MAETEGFGKAIITGDQFAQWKIRLRIAAGFEINLLIPMKF